MWKIVLYHLQNDDNWDWDFIYAVSIITEITVKEKKEMLVVEEQYQVMTDLLW